MFTRTPPKSLHSLDKRHAEFLSAAAKGQLDTLVTLLLESHTDVNAQDDGGRTALMKAAAADQLEAVEILLKTRGILINAATSKL